MITELRYTLLSDGSSDISLLPILNWLLIECGIKGPIQSQWADLRRLQTPPRRLHERIRLSLEFFPCNLLFIHRDAELKSRAERANEIRGAMAKIALPVVPHNIYVIPIHMTEAWLLFNEAAIRFAAGNQRGQNPLSLPHIDSLESISDPKELLYRLILEASNAKGRRLKRLNPQERVHRITSHIDDFSPLRSLSAFRSLEEDVLVFATKHWHG